jgi:hypothetical protein
MNQQSINKQYAYQIIKNGTFYYPAYKHYENITANVVCDFCNKSNLKCAIGYLSSDLCLNCTETISNSQSNTNKYPPKLHDLHDKSEYIPMTRMKQSSVRKIGPSIATYMMQDSIRKQGPSITTNMMQDSIRKQGSSITTNMMQDSIRKQGIQHKQDYEETMTFMMQDSVKPQRKTDMSTIWPYNL